MLNVEQVYRFLKAPQTEQTIMRVVKSKKGREVIAAAIALIEVVAVLIPVILKTRDRLVDLVTIIRPRQVNNRAPRRLPAPSRQNVQHV
jgi:hypothetical protein